MKYKKLYIDLYLYYIVLGSIRREKLNYINNFLLYMYQTLVIAKIVYLIVVT